MGPCLPVDGLALVWCSLGLLQPHPESGLAVGQGSICSQCLWPLLYPGCAPELPGYQTGVSQSQTWTSSGCCKGEGDPESQLHCLLEWTDGQMEKRTNPHAHGSVLEPGSTCTCVQVQVCGTQGYWGASAPTYLRSPSLGAGFCLLPPPPAPVSQAPQDAPLLIAPPVPSALLPAALASPLQYPASLRDRGCSRKEGRLDLASEWGDSFCLCAKKGTWEEGWRRSLGCSAPQHRPLVDEPSSWTSGRAWSTQTFSPTPLPPALLPLPLSRLLPKSAAAQIG